MHVISFSLWGDDPKYVVGALRNAALAPSIYPGWRCRFYCGASVPAACLEQLEAMPHVDVVRRVEPGDWTAMFWRFVAAADPGVEAVIFRDCDSRLNHRERAAVAAWLAGSAGVHVMRDHRQHRAPILGGMWGVRGRVLADMPALIDAYTMGDYWQIDQEFLRAVIAPRIRRQWLAHDEFFDGVPFPTRRRGGEFVGQPFDAGDRPLAVSPPSFELAARRVWRRLRGDVPPVLLPR